MSPLAPHAGLSAVNIPNLVVRCAGRQETHKKAPRQRGFFEERLMGFEPTTFCMASRRSSQLSYSRERSEYSHGT